jgi:hypothetical protein
VIEPTYSFRIIGITDEELSVLVGKIPDGVGFRKGRDHKDRDKKLLRIVLDENTSADFLATLISGLPEGTYRDFLVSIASPQESLTVEISEHVLSLYRQVGGAFCFSYTCTGAGD